ncbi:hypothetical protein [Carboxylicivirga caseinilyticus]|uniref:hypothetical protein n=1 Tax=Carboxylicivirga caseinilyticus TaxID=3417572 RepID=UPI003D343525|nr:hypothetical protein [Marinilabiliaceae bacterium A049]
MYEATKIQFYASLQGFYVNKLFTFKIKGMQQALRIIRQFVDKDNNIHSVFITALNYDTGEVINEKQDLEMLLYRALY